MVNSIQNFIISQACKIGSFTTPQRSRVNKMNGLAYFATTTFTEI